MDVFVTVMYFGDTHDSRAGIIVVITETFTVSDVELIAVAVRLPTTVGFT